MIYRFLSLVCCLLALGSIFAQLPSNKYSSGSSFSDLKEASVDKDHVFSSSFRYVQIAFPAAAYANNLNKGYLAYKGGGGLNFRFRPMGRKGQSWLFDIGALGGLHRYAGPDDTTDIATAASYVAVSHVLYPLVGKSNFFVPYAGVGYCYGAVSNKYSDILQLPPAFWQAGMALNLAPGVYLEGEYRRSFLSAGRPYHLFSGGIGLRGKAAGVFWGTTAGLALLILGIAAAQ